MKHFGIENPNPPVFNITRADLNSAARGLNMIGMTTAELRDLIQRNRDSHLFAGQVITAAANEILQVKLFNCAE